MPSSCEERACIGTTSVPVITIKTGSIIHVIGAIVQYAADCMDIATARTLGTGDVSNGPSWVVL
eukprot:scaffold330345_cov35-Attheya_sp.AAC.1